MRENPHLDSEGEPAQPSLEQFQHNLTRLFIASYEHSQGNQPLQSLIFGYFHTLHPDYRIDDATKDTVSLRCRQIVDHLILTSDDQPRSRFPHKAVDDDGILVNVDKEFNIFCTILNGRPATNTRRMVKLITAYMIQRDHIYLSMDDGRVARSNRGDEPYHRLRDPFFSYICHYALLGRSTGIWEMDHLYRAVNQECQRLATVVSQQQRRHNSPAQDCGNVSNVS
jgi:hypothetical protein